MTRITGAQQRLMEAFGRLESAVEASQSGSVAAQAQLSQELAGVRMDHDAVRASARQVSGRLDGALARLDRLLEE